MGPVLFVEHEVEDRLDCKNRIGKRMSSIKFSGAQKSNQKKQYKVEIDFEEASKAWRHNKVKIGFGKFQYVRRSNRVHYKRKCPFCSCEK